MNEYPYPCDGCKHNINDSCNQYKHCRRWLTRYRYRQKQINAYSRKCKIPKYEVVGGFVYDPRATKEFLENGPCAKCELEPGCDTICEARALWWDVRMEKLKRSMAEQRP